MTPLEWLERWPNFAAEEVLSPIALRRYETGQLIAIDPIALDTLQEFRTKIKIPLHVNYRGLNLRGYRTPKEHTALGYGSSMSPHCRGCAFDITAEGMPIHTLKSLAYDFKKFKGIGEYNTFLHVDTWDRYGDGRIVQWRKL